VSDSDRDALIEAATTPHRGRDLDGRIVPPPAWWDLSPDDREELFERQLLSRVMEGAMDPDGRSGTVKAVLHRIGG
jgi:hypothetical protein